MSEQVTPSTQYEVVAAEEMIKPDEIETSAETALVEIAEPANQEVAPAIGEALLKNIIEAALLTSPEPLSVAELKKMIDVSSGNGLIENILHQLLQDIFYQAVTRRNVDHLFQFFQC